MQGNLGHQHPINQGKPVAIIPHDPEHHIIPANPNNADIQEMHERMYDEYFLPAKNSKFGMQPL